ncbi:hypothetical protein HBB16_05235 [Pseudonocardia sp. MCCB 268]|nr:hypothetical protein [Pseudonocardia cytotoxica]
MLTDLGRDPPATGSTASPWSSNDTSAPAAVAHGLYPSAWPSRISARSTAVDSIPALYGTTQGPYLVASPIRDGWGRLPGQP